MSTLIRAGLVASVLASASQAMARNSHDPYWTDMSVSLGGGVVFSTAATSRTEAAPEPNA